MFECVGLGSDTLTAACWQARAAHVQGGLTLLAGVLAAVGAVWAGHRAYLGALRQAKLNEDIHQARLDAYRFKLKMVVSDVLGEATIHVMTAKEVLNEYKENSSHVKKVPNHLYVIPAELRPEDWERHALLGVVIVKALHHAMKALHEAYRFGDEMRDKAPDAISRNPTLTDPVELEDGGLSFDEDIAIVQNVKVAVDLRERLLELHQALQ